MYPQAPRFLRYRVGEGWSGARFRNSSSKYLRDGPRHTYNGELLDYFSKVGSKCWDRCDQWCGVILWGSSWEREAQRRMYSGYANLDGFLRQPGAHNVFSNWSYALHVEALLAGWKRCRDRKSPAFTHSPGLSNLWGCAWPSHCWTLSNL